MKQPNLDSLIVSPCSNPELSLDECFARYSKLGYRRFEAFTSWVNSSIDLIRRPDFYLNKANAYGIRFASMHLPPVTDDIETTLPAAVKAARFARDIGAEVVLFKASSRKNYIAAGPRFLDAIEDLAITPVLQNHYGTPISSLADFREVIDGINDDRMKTLLEVGHFHSAGVSWREGWNLLRDSVALVHIKDQVGSKPVPFGVGEIDLPGLFRHMASAGYTGGYVVEMEAAMGDTERTLELLQDGYSYLQNTLEECVA